MTRSYYQTTPLTQTQLIGAQRVAKTQDERILALFRRFPHRPLAASQVHEALSRIFKESGGSPVPLLTSVRRSLSTLAKEGLLDHLSLMIVGPHGRPETLYQLAKDRPDQG